MNFSMADVQLIQEDFRNKQRKNGKIEFLRFLFCIAVLLFHAEKYTYGEPSLKNGIHFALFPHGSIGVEFFFVLSGFLMAKSIFRKVQNSSEERKKEYRNEKSDSSTEYLGFIFRKYTGIFPEHLIAFVITVIAYTTSKHMGMVKTIRYVVDSIPNLLLIQMSGIKISNPNHVEWYISCMLFSMAIIYPICRKFYYSFTRYFSPLFSVLLLGYMIQTTGALTGVGTWMGIGYKSMFRALAEVSLGTTAFEISRFLMTKEFSKRKKLFLTIAEFACVIFSLLFILMTFPKKYEIYVLGVMIILIVLCFSEVTYGKKLFNNNFCYMLGKFSLPVYLGQLSAVYLVQGFMKQYTLFCQYIAIIGITFISAVIIMIGAYILRKLCLSPRR
jgi:peptidoglycan/LPS O-acetylase OafA/YrhL